MKSNWVKKCLRREMVGLHIPDYDQMPAYSQLQKEYHLAGILEKIDPRGFVKELKKAHVQAFWFYSKCHYGNAYYPSKVGHVHSALKGRDIFKEFTEACLAENIVPLAVYEFSDRRMPDDHPDWCHRRPVKNVEHLDITDANQGTKLGGPCLNGPYGDFAIEQALEVVKHYPIQGYYVDFLGLFNHADWRCQYCNAKFREVFGFDFQGVTDMDHDQYVAYIKWFYRQNDLYAKKMRQAIKAVRPDVVFVHNFHGLFHDVGLQRADFAAENSDFLTADIFNLRVGSLAISRNLRMLASASRVKPAEALLDSMVCTPGDFVTPKALDGYRGELWTARALNVATCASAMLNIDGTVESSVIALAKKIYGEQLPYEPWLRDMAPLATVGLVSSHNSIEFVSEAEPSLIAKSHHGFEHEGWAQVLIAAHQLWDIVSEHQLTPEYLKRFNTLVLPQVSCMNADQVEAIRSFVKNGGALIATGNTSLFDADGHQQKNFQLADVFGADFVEARKPERGQLRILERKWRPSEKWIGDVLMFSDGQMAVKARPGAKAAAAILLKPNIKLVSVLVPTSMPAILTTRYGKGRCVYFAGLPGLHFRCFGPSNIKRIMRQVIMELSGALAPIAIEAPDSVELFAHRQTQKNRLVVNLVNIVAGVSRDGNSGKYRADNRERFDDITEMPRIAAITIKFRNLDDRKIKRVYLAPNRQNLPLKRSREGVSVTLANVGVHAMVVAEY